MDIMNIVLAALSILVTVLICWQVFNVINLECYKKEIKKYRDEVKSIVKKEIKDYDNTVLAMVNLLYGICYLPLKKNPIAALELYMDAVSILNLATNKEPLDYIIDQIDRLLSDKANVKVITSKVSPDILFQYLHYARKSNSDELIELLSELMKNVKNKKSKNDIND
jgi:cell division protein FtsI/penicillin-binding protein 2